MQTFHPLSHNQYVPIGKHNPWLHRSLSPASGTSVSVCMEEKGQDGEHGDRWEMVYCGQSSTRLGIL